MVRVVVIDEWRQVLSTNFSCPPTSKSTAQRVRPETTGLRRARTEHGAPRTVPALAAPVSSSCAGCHHVQCHTGSDQEVSARSMTLQLQSDYTAGPRAGRQRRERRLRCAGESSDRCWSGMRPATTSGCRPAGCALCWRCRVRLGQPGPALRGGGRLQRRRVRLGVQRRSGVRAGRAGDRRVAARADRAGHPVLHRHRELLLRRLPGGRHASIALTQVTDSTPNNEVIWTPAVHTSSSTRATRNSSTRRT